MTWWLAPRGISNTLSWVPELGEAFATGALVTRRWLADGVVPVAPLSLAAFYVAEPKNLARALKLLPAVPSQANFVLARPRDATLLEGRESQFQWDLDRGILRSAPLMQALADLLSLPGRAVEEGEQLMERLAEVEDSSWVLDG